MPYCYRWRAWRFWLPVWARRTVQARGLQLFAQRGRRGWSDEDLWAFDVHLSRMIAQGFRAMVERGTGYPGDEAFPTPEAWNAFLLEAADDLEYWTTDEGFADDASLRRAQRAMVRVAEHWGTYWD